MRCNNCGWINPDGVQKCEKCNASFRKCHNGHYFQGDTCPYCKNKTITIGRASDNDFIINNPYVSKHHCKIEYVGELKCNLVDLESVNGTFVNGIRVNGSCFLEPFDTVTVGNVNVPWMHYFSFADDSIDDRMPLAGYIEPPR